MAAVYRSVGRKLLGSNARFDIYFDALELPDGGFLPDFLTVRPRVQDTQGIAGVFVLPEVNGKVGLMRTYRHQFSCEIWQVPGGFMEPGESAQFAALRELNEETGLICQPETLISLGSVCPDAGLVEGRVALFLAHCNGQVAEPAAEREIGMGRLEYFSPTELEDILNHAANIGGATAVAGYRYLSLLGRSSSGRV